MLRNLLINKKTKIVITILMIGIFWGGNTFAANDLDLLDKLGISMHCLLSFLSRGRVLFSILAGKLMTNDWIYGSILHMDQVLWKLWNIMKNFANFTIGFLFLFYIIKAIFQPFNQDSNITQFFKNKLVGFLIAGVLIQASWFLIGAVIDISTIATSAVATLPANIIETDASTQDLLERKFDSSFKDFTYMPDNQIGDQTKAEPSQLTGDKGTFDKFLDSIIPQVNDLSGPFIFMGLSIFEFNNMTIEDTPKDWGGFLVETSIQFLVLFMYTILMILLFIINLIRVVLLRIFVIISPFLILIGVLKATKVMEKDVDEMFNLPKWITLSNMIKLIFKPVIYTAFMSIMLIFVIGVWNVMKIDDKKRDIDLEFIETKDESTDTDGASSSINIPGLGNFTVFTNSLKSGFSNVLVYIMAIVLMWMLMKIALKTGGEMPKFVDKITKGATDMVEGAASTANVIPIGGGTSFSAISSAAKKIKRDLTTGEGSLRGIQDKQLKNLNAALGLTGSWENEYTTKLGNIIDSSTKTTKSKISDFFSESKSIANNLSNGMYITNSNWNPILLEMLQKHGLDQNETGLGKDDSINSVEQYFNGEYGQKRIKKFLKLMGSDKENISNYTQLSKINFGKED